MHGKANDDGPGEDPNVVGPQEGVNRVIHDVHDQRMKDLGNPAGRIDFTVSNR